MSVHLVWNEPYVEMMPCCCCSPSSSFQPIPSWSSNPRSVVASTGSVHSERGVRSVGLTGHSKRCWVVWGAWLQAEQFLSGYLVGFIQASYIEMISGSSRMIKSQKNYILNIRSWQKVYTLTLMNHR